MRKNTRLEEKTANLSSRFLLLCFYLDQETFFFWFRTIITEWRYQDFMLCLIGFSGKMGHTAVPFQVELGTDQSSNQTGRWKTVNERGERTKSDLARWSGIQMTSFYFIIHCLRRGSIFNLGPFFFFYKKEWTGFYLFIKNLDSLWSDLATMAAINSAKLKKTHTHRCSFSHLQHFVASVLANAGFPSSLSPLTTSDL